MFDSTSSLSILKNLLGQMKEVGFPKMWNLYRIPVRLTYARIWHYLTKLLNISEFTRPCIKWNPPNSEIGWHREVSVPGAFKLDHLHPIKPLLFWKFSKIFTFILGGQFLLPQRANYQKREFFQPQNWMRQRLFSDLGIQTGPFASH